MDGGGGQAAPTEKVTLRRGQMQLWDLMNP